MTYKRHNKVEVIESKNEVLKLIDQCILKNGEFFKDSEGLENISEDVLLTQYVYLK